MNALKRDVRLPARLDRWTDPDLDLNRVAAILPLRDTTLVALREADGAYLYRLDGDRGPLVRMDGVGPLSAGWPGGSDHILAHAEEALWRISPAGARARLTDLPEATVEAAAAWHADALVAACLVDRSVDPDPEAPQLHPEPRPVLTLVHYRPATGWVDLAEVPAGVQQLSLSHDGTRMAWIEHVNVVPEEARRGEVRTYDVAQRQLRYLTTEAGKLDAARIAPDGSGVLYEANHETRRPVTTHPDVWWVRWDGAERRNLTGGGRCVVGSGWGPGSGEVWISEVDGLTLRSEILHVDGRPAKAFGPAPASARPVWTADGVRMHEGESAGQYPRLYVGRRTVRLPQPASYSDLRIRSVAWEAPDGLKLEGVVYETSRTRDDAPLLVRVHGGPAGEVAALRSQAVRHRHLLKAGYRVFNPAFRGSLGFGDAFLGANIGCQGEADLDDILSGIDHLADTGAADAERVGIFGGSYGGYMTLRAMAVTDRFRAGVASFGFVHNRWMTLETGDFTYETEYVAPPAWPPSARSQRGNVFQHLGAIDAPLLLMHGDRDTICPLSQSRVAYRALASRDVPTGLVVYPGEGHGFRKRANRRDAERRTLAWFLTHLPPEGGA